MTLNRFLLAAITILLGVAPAQAADPAKRPNILMIAVDDLRPQLGCYGQTQMVSPNIDRLASGGIVFNRSYCMVPTCGASRASLMTSIRPSRNRFVTHLAWADKETGGLTTLNTHLKNNGYYTLSNGKIFHHPEDSAGGWSEPAWRPERSGGHYALPANQQLVKTSGKGPAWEMADVPDNAYADGKLAEKAITDLQRLSKQDQPFFLAVGFFKPHLPFVAPKKYWDLYDHGKIQVPATYHRPKDAPAESIHNSGELRGYAGVPKDEVLPQDYARQLIHGYYACVSYTDAQVGKLLDELKRLGLEEDTIVLLWGDHGWNLGEHTMWCKHCCYETSMRTPLIFRVPGMAGGRKTDGIVEYIDIYPTLCELTGLDAPSHVQGKSFVPLMKDPTLAWKEAAIGRFGNGDTIRTDQFRFAEYTTGDAKQVARMLYDHKADPGEDTNVAEQPANTGKVKELTDHLHDGMGRDWEINKPGNAPAKNGGAKKKAKAK